MFSLFWFLNKNEPPESVGEVNSPSSDESSEFEEVWPEIETFHEPLCFNGEDVVNGEDVEQTSAVEESQIILDNETDFVLVENIKTEKEDEERVLNSELRGYEEESSSCEEMVRIIKSENPEIISKSSRAEHEYGIFPYKEANFILGKDINNEVLDEDVSLNSESRERELKEEESILDNEVVNNVMNSENKRELKEEESILDNELVNNVMNSENKRELKEEESILDNELVNNVMNSENKRELKEEESILDNELVNNVMNSESKRELKEEESILDNELVNNFMNSESKRELKEEESILDNEVVNDVMNSESKRELKEEESILDKELVSNVMNSEKATTPANGSIGQRSEVALEVLSYHNTCTKEEFESLKDIKIPDNLPGVDKFSFNSLELKEKMVPHLLYMFNDLFGVRDFDKESLIRFFFTVRRNYRGVPYHNWKHGFCVAHSMYVIIKGSPCVFNHLEKLALFIGALCHDMDYRGTTNQFPLESDNPLVDLYSTESSLEHHHFNMIVQLLQEEGHNIFDKLKPSDYKKVLDNMKHCILATDLKKFFENKKIIEELIDEESFDMEDLEHRLLLQALTMTSCDISASAKPWKIHVEYANEVIEEFYTQGDEKKRSGKTLTPMMDRDKPEEQVLSQIEFISGFCISCYELFAKLIPPSASLLQESKNNLEQYKWMKKKTS